MSKMLKFINCLIIMLICSTPVMAKTMNNKLIENMTWDQVAELQKSNQVIIIPLGAAAKEHGLHLPLNNDFIMANYLRDRVLSRLDYALALPTVNYSYYPGFLEYPGSTSIDSDVAQQFIVDICRSLARQGFKKFYVLNTGFSTNKPLAAAQKELASEKISMAYLVPQDFFDSSLVNNLTQQKIGGHADEVETSMMLYMAPNIVQMGKAVKDEVPGTSGPLTRNPNNTGRYSPTGALGDPTLATREKGKVITEAYVDFILKQINAFIASG